MKAGHGRRRPAASSGIEKLGTGHPRSISRAGSGREAWKAEPHPTRRSSPRAPAAVSCGIGAVRAQRAFAYGQSDAPGSGRSAQSALHVVRQAGAKDTADLLEYGEPFTVVELGPKRFHFGHGLAAPSAHFGFSFRVRPMPNIDGIEVFDELFRCSESLLS